ncbi:MAG: dTMP kinase [Betaproteobacteria bacterium]|nr:dTMP kinase [Betaproteobacteria bacterium]MDE1981975.1 dTMP kinase [Betaproteobacteria bacterium]MDE2131902.1 dTMP kinase [Betaproteobacteria bacterium]MDE2211084.1 dTMP kinase [Betaproteobacteria bacterium]
MTTPGKFISLEGIDGAGKSTHLNPIAEWLRARAREVVVTREPGGTPLGESLRQLLLHQSMNPDTEALVMFAARREHVVQVIAPALARGAWVVSDRYTDASFAYQGGGRGVHTEHLRHLESWVEAGIRPHLTLLFDLDPEEAHRRVVKGTPHPDRFEREQDAFFRKVRAAYLERASQEPERFCILDSSQTPEAIFGQVCQALERLAP